jgi:hypothetical protein
MKNKSEGLYDRLKNNTEKPVKYTKEYLIEVFKEVFNRPVDENKKVELPLEWKHFEWEKDGQQYSCWKLSGGGFPILTIGDGGKEAFDKLFKEEIEKYGK